MGLPLLDEIKDVAALAKAVGNMDLYRKIVDLQGEVLQLSQEKFELQQKVRDLQAQLTTQMSVTPPNAPDPFFYTGCQRICPLCWQKESKIINVIGKSDCKTCPSCETTYHQTAEGHWKVGEPAFDGISAV